MRLGVSVPTARADGSPLTGDALVESARQIEQAGSGFKIAPAVGACVAELITDGRAKTVDIDAFGLRRFAEGKTVEGRYPYAVRPDHVDRALTGRA